MMKLLIINVTSPQNMISDTIMHVTRNTLNIVVVVVYFLKFYFHGKGIINVHYLHDHPLVTPLTYVFCMVIYPWGGCSCSCGITREVQGQGSGRKLSRQSLQHYNPRPSNITIAQIYSQAQDMRKGETTLS